MRSGNRQAAHVPAFTLVELLVVVLIIATVLGIGLPAFSNMTTQSRFNQAVQLANGVLTRAQILAVSDRTPTAVRFFPAAWDLNLPGDAASAAAVEGRQNMAVYRYSFTTTGDPLNPLTVAYSEWMRRADDIPGVLLPVDTWVAPGEATTDAGNLTTNGDAGVLNGQIGAFRLDAADPANAAAFLDADDFLVVFHHERGLLNSVQMPPWQIQAYVPPADPGNPVDPEGLEVAGDNWNATDVAYEDPFRRFGYGSLAFYRRELLTSLGANAADTDRRAVLELEDQVYSIAPGSGALVKGE